jgi:branched-chain amino acid transport system substrate-binding protein
MKAPFRSHIAVLSILVIAFIVGTGCGGNVARRTPEVPSVDADSLHAILKNAFAAGRYDVAEAAARHLITDHPRYEAADEVCIVGARACQQLEDYAQAVKYSLFVVDNIPLSPHREEALFIAADAYGALRKYDESADMLLRLLSSPVDPEMEARALTSLKALAQDHLGTAELDRLLKQYPSSPLAGDMSLTLAKREFARGNYEAAYALLSELLYQSPQYKESPEVQQLLQLSASRRGNPDAKLSYVVPNKIGVFLPLTGNFARYGRYFEQGLTVALDEFNAAGGVTVAWVKADSRSNPVDAVTAVRKLVIEEGVVAVLGSVLVVPSVAAAIECNALQVPIVSPVPTDQPIDEIGPWVFEIKVPSEIEVSAMARVAREDLLLERFAVLAPATGEKQKLSEYFVQEILSRGGVVVANQSYEEGATDFKEQLEVIGEAAPEALFIPGEPEELILMLPQIAFYELQIQLIGLSNWNSEKLLRLSQRELEGAVFPGEALHGKNRESYQRFVSEYEKRFGGEVHPVATAAYFGMRVLLQSISAGAIDRKQVRDHLTQELGSGAERRVADAAALSILNVRSGKVRELAVSSRKR